MLYRWWVRVLLVIITLMVMPFICLWQFYDGTHDMVESWVRTRYRNRSEKSKDRAARRREDRSYHD